MAVRKFKPVTPGTRHKIIGTFDEITTNVPEKSLVSVKKSSGGRNNTGKMTVRYIGGGHKRMYRHVDFKRVKDGVAATVSKFSYCLLAKELDHVAKTHADHAGGHASHRSGARFLQGFFDLPADSATRCSTQAGVRLCS